MQTQPIIMKIKLQPERICGILSVGRRKIFKSFTLYLAGVVDVYICLQVCGWVGSNASTVIVLHALN